MRHCRIICVILQHYMKQCGEVVLHPACPIVSDAQQQKGGVSMLPLTNLNITQGFLSCFLVYVPHMPCSSEH
jgi:hypothetical protein